MSERDGFNLAIETSSRFGSVSLGRGSALLGTAELPEQRRHAVELMPAIDRLCREHGAGASDLGEIYVSLGPGSFTGLRVGVTTAKVLAHVTGAKLVGVPTLEAIARNAPPDAGRLAVMLSAKGGRWFTGVFEGGRPDGEPGLMTLQEMAQRMGEDPIALIADPAPAYDWPPAVRVLDRSLATPRSAAVWAIGRERSAAGRWTPAMELVPMYVRLPEAEELWQSRRVSSGAGR